MLKKMRLTILFLLFFCIHKTSFKITSSTVSQKDRIHILRQVITEEIREAQNKSGVLRPIDVEDSSVEALDYEENENLPITPIMNTDDLKRNEKFKLRAVTSTVKMSTDSNNVSTSKRNDSLSLRIAKKKNIRKKRIRVKKPLEIFYRRYYDKDIMHRRLEWAHCQDLITPFLSGTKMNISNPKRLSSKDATVIRFISLLNINTTSYSREDIYSILYQISNLHLRLFQWDVVSLNMLLNVIIKEKKHTFGNLKRGLHDLFHNWRLDFTNTTSLLKQARIFRPPCVQISSFDGSTKSPKVTKYPKKIILTTPCEDDDDCKEY